MPEPVHLGRIGLGRLGLIHAENLTTLPGCRLIAVVSCRLEVGRATAERLGVPKVYVDHQALLADDDVQAVAIVSATRDHARHIVEAAQAGKHVYAEKPIALTLADADAALAAVEWAGVHLQLGFQRRFDPAYVAAKRRIDAGDIGRLHGLHERQHPAGHRAGSTGA